MMARFLRYPIDIWPILATLLGCILAFLALFISERAFLFWSLFFGSIPLRLVASAHHHCHAHLSVFKGGLANFIYDIALSLMAGYTTPGWQLQHCHAHHRYLLEAEIDPANANRFGENLPFKRLFFTLFGDFLSFYDAWRFAPDAAKKARWFGFRRRLVMHATLRWVLVFIALYVDLKGGFWFGLVLPQLIRWSVFWGSYGQHANLPLDDLYGASRTHFGPMNRLLLNVGHHTAHHEKPTLHWSLLPQRTEKIRHRLNANVVVGEG